MITDEFSRKTVTKYWQAVLLGERSEPHIGLFNRDFACVVCMYVGLYRETHTKNTYTKMRGRNYVAQTRACSKSVLGS